MDRAYVLFQLQIINADGYREYASADHAGMLKKFNAKIVGADADSDVLEGDWPYRTVLVEFPSKEVIYNWFQSEEYQAVAALRHRSAHSNVVIISGT